MQTIDFLGGMNRESTESQCLKLNATEIVQWLLNFGFLISI